VMANPTRANSFGRRLPAARWYRAGSSLRLLKSPSAPKTTITQESWIWVIEYEESMLMRRSLGPAKVDDPSHPIADVYRLVYLSPSIPHRRDFISPVGKIYEQPWPRDPISWYRQLERTGWSNNMYVDLCQIRLAADHKHNFQGKGWVVRRPFLQAYPRAEIANATCPVERENGLGRSDAFIVRQLEPIFGRKNAYRGFSQS